MQKKIKAPYCCKYKNLKLENQTIENISQILIYIY